MITRKKGFGNTSMVCSIHSTKIKNAEVLCKKIQADERSLYFFFLSLFCQYTKHCSQQGVIQFFFSGEVDIPEKGTFSIHDLPPLIILVKQLLPSRPCGGSGSLPLRIQFSVSLSEQRRHLYIDCGQFIQRSL